MRILLLIMAAALLFACNSGKQETPADNNETSASENLDIYCNARFSYCIAYPSGLLTPQPESENGDGRVFTNKEGKEILTVFGRLNMDAEGDAVAISQQFKDDIESFNEEASSNIVYQKLDSSFFVLSGYRNGQVFYQKTILKGDAYAYAILLYPVTEKSIYDPLAEKIFTAFR